MKVLYICIIIVILLFILFLDRCTSRNISTAFNSSEFYKYPSLAERPSSKNYEIKKLMSQVYVQICYDPVNRFFIIANADSVIKIDANGRQLYVLQQAEMSYARYTDYVMDSTGIYDFSKEKLEKTAFKQVLNADQKMSKGDWQLNFDHYYKSADVVLYGINNYYGNSNPIYFKINGDWTVLLNNHYDERWDDSDRVSGVRFKGYPEKYNPLFLLKDPKKGLYSDVERTDDEFLKTYYTVKIKESSMAYPTDREISVLSYKKTGVFSRAAYINIPIDWSVKAGYLMNVNTEQIYFKGDATLALGFFKPIDTYLGDFRVPEEFSSQTDVSFLRFSFPSNGEGSEHTGIYIVKSK